MINNEMIVAQGLSGSGKYVKFSNGFIRQSGNAIINGTTTFPTVFAETPTITLTVKNAGEDHSYIGAVTLLGTPGTATFTTSPVATIQGTSSAIEVMYVAEGF